MPKFYNEEKLKELLLENRVPITDAVNRENFIDNILMVKIILVS